MQDKLYLKSLFIKNFATFTDQRVVFETSFNAIIGETGSGKSLLLDAIELVLGSRADKKLIRKGSEFASVEGVFIATDKKTKEFFDELGYPIDEDEIIVKRILYPSGKSKSYLNHQSTNLTTLQNFSKRFIDLVGQFENQKLLSETYQLVLLDNYSKLNTLRTQYQNSYRHLQKVQKEIATLKEQKLEHGRRTDYIEFQIKELEALNPSVEAEGELLKQKDIITNLEDRIKFSNDVQQIFEPDDSEAKGLSELLSLLEKKILANSNFISDTLSENFYNAKETLQDLNYEISQLQNDQLDEEQLDAVMETLDAYQKLKSKYNSDTGGLVQIFEDFIQERLQLEKADINFDLLQAERQKLENDCLSIAEELHNKRCKQAIKLSKELSSAIQSLRMVGASMRIRCEKTEGLTPLGITTLYFEAQTNPGEGFFRVKEIASGGELSRILLATRKILSSTDSINVFLFDEIDTGIGGETALHIGRALGEVSQNSQVIAITHLPQIAIQAKKLIVVSKSVTSENKKERTISHIKEIQGKEKESFVVGMTPLA